MSRQKLSSVSVSELVEDFVRIALAQDVALLESDHDTYNRLFDHKERIATELEGRSGDQRRALLPLYNHPNAQVRYAAAAATIAVNRAGAHRVFEIISERHEFPQAANARGLLRGDERRQDVTTSR